LPFLQRARLICGLALLAAIAFAAPFLALWLTDRAGADEPVAERSAPATPPPRATLPPALTLLPAGTHAPERPSPPVKPLKPWQPGAEDRVLAQVRAALASSYYLPVASGVLEQRSIVGMLGGLRDPYTEYLDPVEFGKLRRTTSGRYGGLGLYVGPTDGGLVVTSVRQRPVADIRPGDVIVSVNGTPVQAVGYEQAVALITGKPGTLVRLTIRRPGEGRLDVPVVRREIEEQAVSTRTLRAGKTRLGYLSLRTFGAGAGEQVRAAAARLLDGGVEGMVLDVRGNPGGLVEEAVDVASVFLRSGALGSASGFHRGVSSLLVRGNALAPDLPLVVLVDRASASASEIVAAALHEHHRAVLVGTSTFGKAAIQSLRPLADGGALRYTSAMYATPSGANIGRVGVRPVVRVVDDPLSSADEALKAAKRALLALVRGDRGPRALPF
jgi:carboxyl-terminal processing protease